MRSTSDLLLQMRSPLKDQYPSTWTSSASGHVDAGESYHEAAVRELQEELGLAAPVREVTKRPASAETAYEFTSLWICESDERPLPNPVEVTSVEWWSIDDIADRIKSTPDLFSPPLRELIHWWNGRTL